MMTASDMAALLGVAPAQVRRLMRAGLLAEAMAEHDYRYVRLLLDLLDAGLTPAQLRRLAGVSRVAHSAAESSRQLVALIDQALPSVTTRLERVRRVREELIRTREALHRCRACHKPFEDLGCRTCRAMPAEPPRPLDQFFLPPGDDNPRHR